MSMRTDHSSVCARECPAKKSYASYQRPSSANAWPRSAGSTCSMASRRESSSETTRIDPGAIPFAGFFVLQHWPEYAEIRADPRFERRLARIRPEYATRWPGMATDGR